MFTEFIQNSKNASVCFGSRTDFVAWIVKPRYYKSFMQASMFLEHSSNLWLTLIKSSMHIANMCPSILRIIAGSFINFVNFLVPLHKPLRRTKNLNSCPFQENSSSWCKHCVWVLSNRHLLDQFKLNNSLVWWGL